MKCGECSGKRIDVAPFYERRRNLENKLAVYKTQLNLLLFT